MRTAAYLAVCRAVVDQFAAAAEEVCWLGADLAHGRPRLGKDPYRLCVGLHRPLWCLSGTWVLSEYTGVLGYQFYSLAEVLLEGQARGAGGVTAQPRLTSLAQEIVDSKLDVLLSLTLM